MRGCIFTKWPPPLRLFSGAAKPQARGGQKNMRPPQTRRFYCAAESVFCGNSPFWLDWPREARFAKRVVGSTLSKKKKEEESWDATIMTFFCVWPFSYAYTPNDGAILRSRWRPFATPFATRASDVVPEKSEHCHDENECR